MKLAGTIKKKVKEDIAIGTTVTLADLGVTEGLGLAGLDFVWIDMEHTALGKIEVCGHIIAAKASQIASFVRVPWNDPVQMKPILDMGPDGLIVPQIRSLQDAKNAIAACLYPPKGVRGFGPLRASGYGTYNITQSLPDDYKPTLLFLQVEHADCVACIDDILALEGLDGLIFGPMDLSASIGKLGKMDDAELNQIMDDLSHKIIQSGKILGVSMAYRPEKVTAWIKRGATFLSLGQDIEILLNAVGQMVGSVETLWQEASDIPPGSRPRRRRGLEGREL
jgi:2-dehydro-3-deoxyglucarate aldolase/4-hydroxy-2-oxoheptanedioate aldolase